MRRTQPITIGQHLFDSPCPSATMLAIFIYSYYIIVNSRSSYQIICNTEAYIGMRLLLGQKCIIVISQFKNMYKKKWIRDNQGYIFCKILRGPGVGVGVD